jgi:hypothetical protein
MTDGMIPEERLNKEIEKRKALETQGAELRAKVAQLEAGMQAHEAQAGALDGLRSELGQARSALDSANRTNSAHVSMMEAGVKDSGVRDYMIFQHQQHKTQAGDNAATWGDWWDGQVTAKPEVLRPFLSPPAQPQQAAPAEAAPTPAPAYTPAPTPTTNNGAQTTPPPPPDYVPGSISGMSMADFRANKEGLIASINGGPWNGSS